MRSDDEAGVFTSGGPMANLAIGAARQAAFEREGIDVGLPGCDPVATAVQRTRRSVPHSNRRRGGTDDEDPTQQEGPGAAAGRAARDTGVRSIHRRRCGRVRARSVVTRGPGSPFAFRPRVVVAAGPHRPAGLTERASARAAPPAGFEPATVRLEDADGSCDLVRLDAADARPCRSAYENLTLTCLPVTACAASFVVVR